MGLFKRKQESPPTPCPRCSQLVSHEDGSSCPMCGWDIHDAYQGPPVERPAARAGGGPGDGSGDAS